MFSFAGRTHRLGYLGAVLVWTLVSVGIFIAFSTMVSENLGSSADFGAAAPMLALFALTPVPVLWGLLAIGVRRAHDIGWSGWWILVSFVPLANLVFGLLLLFLPGQTGENRFGPSPLQS